MLRNPDLIMELQRAVGASLCQCQALENTIVHCLLVENKLDRDEKSSVIEEMFKKYGELTLGQLSKQIELLTDVSVELKEKLKSLTRERNWLVHKSWSDTMPHANSCPPIELERYLDRILQIHDNALQINKEFLIVLEARVKKAGVPAEYIDKKAKEIYERWLTG